MRKIWSLERTCKKYTLDRLQFLKYLLEGFGIILGVAYLFYENLGFSFLLLPYLPFYIKNCSYELRKKREQELITQFKDGMIAVSFSLNVGYSIENSFQEALEELALLYGNNGEIVLQFKNIVKHINLNENIEDILSDFALKTNLEDILYFAEIFRYAKRSGGDLIAIIRNTANTINEKIEVRKEIETVISGKKMEQKIMCMIPFGIILYLKISSPEFMKGLYGNITGVIIMSVCLCMYAGALKLAQTIVNIEV